MLGEKDTPQEHLVSSFCVISASAVSGATRHILSAGVTQGEAFLLMA